MEALGSLPSGVPARGKVSSPPPAPPPPPPSLSCFFRKALASLTSRLRRLRSSWLSFFFFCISFECFFLCFLSFLWPSLVRSLLLFFFFFFFFVCRSSFSSPPRGDRDRERLLLLLLPRRHLRSSLSPLSLEEEPEDVPLEDEEEEPEAERDDGIVLKN